MGRPCKLHAESPPSVFNWEVSWCEMTVKSTAGFPKLSPGGLLCEFSSNPDQTHLSKLIKVFRISRNSQVGVFNQGWS